MDSPQTELRAKSYKGFSARDISVIKSSQTGPQQEKQNAPFLKIRFPERKTHSRPKKKWNTLSVKGKRVPGKTRPLIHVSEGGAGAYLADTRGPRPAGREGIVSFLSSLATAPGRGRAGADEACRRFRPPQAEPDLSTDVGERGGGDPGGCRRWGARERQLRSPQRMAGIGEDGAEAMVDPPTN